jgi:FMN-dependent NADH-azoreductase
MKRILQINASLQSDQGQSSQLATAFVAALSERNPGVKVMKRDLALEPVPHLDAERFGAFLAKPGKRSAAQQAVVNESDALIAELRAADVLVIGLPFYNFGVPSQLKSWFDHIARAGETFRYTEKGPVGLLTGKKAYVFAARGGLHAGTPRDSQTGFVQTFLNFIGIRDVQFVFAEGLAISEASRNESLAAAQSAVRAHAAAAAGGAAAAQEALAA